MKTQTKITALMLIMGLAVAVSSFASPLDGLQKQVDKFADSMAESLPMNSTIGLNWSDAYIGQLISAPPHLGVGVFAGVTTFDMDIIDELAAAMGATVDLDLNKFPMPAFGGDLRIGGFFLPFDVGIKFGMLSDLDLGDININYMLVGGDIRYALLKGNAVLPKISIGVGVNYLKGGVGATLNKGHRFEIGPDYIEVTDPSANFEWETTTLDFKAQISKSFAIITPYLGLGVTHGWSKAGYEIESDILYNGYPMTDTQAKQINNALSAQGVPTIDFDGSKGFSSIQSVNGWGFRAFGGFSINIVVIKIDLSGMYNFLDGNYGGTLGIRFQL
ncbi:DUF6588 family protein [Breznakiella homolactica]|uniref:Outer membrane protein beta-barrel domain-containing protein n=1 Tax=Breznakiella homolactica TaxID=2798577 RepID=A0A7T7XKS4_9SPIR|nr:DUF6588 family protein [Breznakiella homolactica]QQO08235.1 hypothetical protein JFL75_15025 [Breznakiella homolactica]